MPPLNPYKPIGALESFTMRTMETGLGLNAHSVAKQICIYGFDKMDVQQIEYVHHSLHLLNFNELSTDIHICIRIIFVGVSD